MLRQKESHKNYLDESTSFDSKVYKWNWNVKDKRKVKPVKKTNGNKKVGYDSTNF